MRVVITGATGNVGTSLVKRLSEDERVDSILGIARRQASLELPKVRWAAADVVSADLQGLFEGADAVVHLAWVIQPSHDLDVMTRINVEGSRRVFQAAASTGVRTLVHASSVGAYSPGPKDRAVSEQWPTGGVPQSFYSRHKAMVERLLDEVEGDPELRVVRLRPALIFKREAASGIRRLFLGPLVPTRLLNSRRVPVIPRAQRLVFQAVHTDDVAEAYALALFTGVRGAFNITSAPVLDAPTLVDELDARRSVPVPAWLLRGLAALTWRARLQPTPPGWLDLGLAAPVMDGKRAREELGWTPARTSGDALRDLLDGFGSGAGIGTPPLLPDADAPSRWRELRDGVGARVPEGA
ncbi:MAG: NAD-dependent epimerase/dehydratase family protein [Actinomycetota bacterium]